MIKLNGNKLTISKSRILTNKQLIRLKYMNEDLKSRYINSCLGLHKSRVSFTSPKSHGTDLLKFKRKDQYLDMFRSIVNNGSNIDHKPLDKGNWVGIELEFLIPNSSLEHDVCGRCDGSGRVQDDDSENDCSDCDGRGHDSSNIYDQVRQVLKRNKIYRASVRGDGSVNDDDAQGIEITLLLNIDNGFEPLKKLCSILTNQFDAYVNKTCGMHVHFDYRSKGLDQVIVASKRIKKFIPLLAKLNPDSRRSNTYCRLGVSKLKGDRYYAVNLTSFKKHGSIEVRLHSGSLDHIKIKNWIELIQLIFNTKTIGKIDSLQDVLDKLPIKDELAEYLDERYTKFNEKELELAENNRLAELWANRELTELSIRENNPEFINISQPLIICEAA